jgi:glutamate formiminotransferase
LQNWSNFDPQKNNMNQLIECVPNFSEGVDMNIIKQITNAIETVEGVRLLNVDPGKATNRTVVTIVGNPQAVVDAAFIAIKTAGELIDMSKHKGEHPRMGATVWALPMYVLLFLSAISVWKKLPRMRNCLQNVLAKN